TFEAGGDEANVGADAGRLDAGDELAWPAPLPGTIRELMEAAHRRLHLCSPQVALLAPRRRYSQELRVDGEADDVVAAQGFQQRQSGLAAVVTVAAHQDRDM